MVLASFCKNPGKIDGFGKFSQTKPKTAKTHGKSLLKSLVLASFPEKPKTAKTQGKSLLNPF